MSGAARAHAARFYAAVALGVTAVVVALLLRRLSRPTDGLPGPPPESIVDWCGEGLEPIAGGGCFAPPRIPRGGRAAGLLVYLHGRYAPEAAPEELARQARVARMGSARGYGVLALRGKQGQCTDPQLATWWCWPSNERTAADGSAFVARWTTALQAAEERAGKGRRVLLGFSNGGYFAALIASRALVPFDAIAIAHAGPVQPMRPAGATPPILLVDADDDPSGPEMSRLDADLTRESWPHAIVVREGGHALLEWDIDMSLMFFDRARTERLPLSPPLPARTERRPSEPPPDEAGPTPSAPAQPAPNPPAPVEPVPRPAESAPPPATPSPVLDPPE